MEDEVDVYRLTPKGASTARSLVSALCHGHSLDQAAVLSGLDSADEAKIVLYMVLSAAGIVPDVEVLDD